jgi:hypothetical protein
MAYISYNEPVHASVVRPLRRLAWGRLLALAANICLWVGIVATLRAVL